MQSRSKTGRQKFIIRIIFVLGMLLGLGGMVIGIVTATQPEPIVPTCGGLVMQPNQECEHDILVDGIPTSSSVFSYEQQLAATQQQHDRWPIYLGSGAVFFALCLWRFLKSGRPFKPTGSEPSQA